MRKNRTPEKEEEKQHPRSRFQREAAVEATEAGVGAAITEWPRRRPRQRPRIPPDAEEEREARLIAEADADAAVMIENETRFID